jgi:SAM-dependent methyltransferase
MPETLAEYWTRIGDEIQARRDGGFIAGDDTPFHRYKAERVSAMFDEIDLARRSVLDLGCGPGAYLLRASDRGAARVVGCDLSTSMLALAQGNVDGRARLVQVDGHRLPFVDGAFDVAITVTVLQHDDSDILSRLLREMARVTRESIYLFEDVAGDGPLSARIRPAATCRARPVAHPVRRRVGEYAEILADAGFALESRRVLPVMVSEGMAYAIRRLLPSRSEGRAASRAVLATQRALLPMTRRFDRTVRPRGGLCRMEYRRVARL